MVLRSSVLVIAVTAAMLLSQCHYKYKHFSACTGKSFPRQNHVSKKEKNTSYEPHNNIESGTDFGM